jgi:uncharacterized protein YjcR
MLNIEKVKELYLQGYNPCQIAIVLKCNSSTIRQCIHRNLKEFKKSHLAEKIRKKEIDKITRQESKQYMSDKDFIKRNRSIYKTNKNGDIILNKEVAQIVSFDTPKILINEYEEERVNKSIIKNGYRKENLLFNR